jgi:hypothetical protein
MSIKWNKVRKKPNLEFRRIVGVKKETFYFLLEKLRPSWLKKRKAGGPIPKLKLEDQLLLTLSYLRHYSTYLETGAKFGVSETRAYEICKAIESVLITKKALHLPGRKALVSNDNKFEAVVFDVTECSIERPKRRKKGRLKNVQKHYYSGKKKKHTLKEQIVVDQNSKKIIATRQDKGRVHDFKIYKKSKQYVHPDTKIQGDSGYQGIQKIHRNSEIPKKRSKKQPLSREDKDNNRRISSERIIVENVFAFIKKFKIISCKYRNRRKRFGLRFNLICAFYNLECGGGS